jgi:hypothetical protein
LDQQTNQKHQKSRYERKEIRPVCTTRIQKKERNNLMSDDDTNNVTPIGNGFSTPVGDQPFVEEGLTDKEIEWDEFPPRPVGESLDNILYGHTKAIAKILDHITTVAPMQAQLTQGITEKLVEIFDALHDLEFRVAQLEKNQGE